MSVGNATSRLAAPNPLALPCHAVATQPIAKGSLITPALTRRTAEAASSTIDKRAKADATLNASAEKLLVWTKKVERELVDTGFKLLNGTEDQIKAHISRWCFNLAVCGNNLELLIKQGEFQGEDKNAAVKLTKRISVRLNLLITIHKPYNWSKTILSPLVEACWSSQSSPAVERRVRDLPPKFLEILPNPFRCPSMLLLKLQKNLDPVSMRKLKNNVLHNVLYLQHLANKISTDHLGEHAYTEVQVCIKEYFCIAVRYPDFLFKEFIPLLGDYQKVQKEKNFQLHPKHQEAINRLKEILAVPDSSKASPLPASTSASSAGAPGPRVVAADSRAALPASTSSSSAKSSGPRVAVVDNKAALQVRISPSSAESHQRVATAAAKKFKASANEGVNDKARDRGPVASGVRASARKKTFIAKPPPQLTLLYLEIEFNKIKIPKAALAEWEGLIRDIYNLNLTVDALDCIITKNSSHGINEKAKQLLKDVEEKMFQIVKISMEYSSKTHPFLLGDVLLPLMMGFSCFPSYKELLDPTLSSEPALPLPSDFLEKLPNPRNFDLQRVMIRLERGELGGEEEDDLKMQIVDEVNELVCIRDKIKKLGLNNNLYKNAYKEINCRVAQYMKFAANVYLGFLIEIVIPLVSWSEINGIKFPMPEEELLKLVESLQGTSAVTATASTAS